MKIPISFLLACTVLYLAMICSLHSLDRKLDAALDRLDQIEEKMK